jgi:hypothetical protein
MTPGLVVGLLMLGGGALLLLQADSLFERSRRPGTRWVIPEARRLLVIRGAGAIYLLIGVLLVLGNLRR